MHFEDGRTFLNLVCLVNEALRKIPVMDLSFAKTDHNFEGGHIELFWVKKQNEQRWEGSN